MDIPQTHTYMAPERKPRNLEGMGKHYVDYLIEYEVIKLPLNYEALCAKMQEYVNRGNGVN